MPEPACAEVWRHPFPDGCDQRAQEFERSCGQVPHLLLDPRPRHFNGVELRAVSGEVQGGRPELFESLHHTGHAMDGGTIHDHDVAFVQRRSKVFPEVVQEDVAGDVSVDLAQRAYAVERDGSDEVEAPTPRGALYDRRDPTWSPAIPPTLSDAYAGFVDKDELCGVELGLVLDECLPRLDHVWPMSRPPSEDPLFRVYPRRLRVSDMVWVDTSTPRASMYAAPSSLRVQSGLLSTRSRSSTSPASSTFRGPCQPPVGFGSTEPVRLSRETHRFTLASPTLKRFPRLLKEPSPALYAATTRSRSSFGWGLGISTSVMTDRSPERARPATPSPPTRSTRDRATVPVTHGTISDKGPKFGTGSQTDA